MRRRILVRITAAGAITVEAEGFQGNGCEAATKAIEEALGKTTNRVRKPEYRRQSLREEDQQRLEIGGE